MLVPGFPRILTTSMWMMMTRKIKIAAAQYPLDELQDLRAYEAKITRWVEEALEAGAELLVFPEYSSMELASIGGKAGDVQASFDAVSALVPELDRVHSGLAAKHGVTIVAGSGPQPGGLHDECGAYLRATGTGQYDKSCRRRGARPMELSSATLTFLMFHGAHRPLICYA